MHKGGVPEREGVAGGVPELERVAVAVGVPELERVAVAVGVGDSEEEGVLKMEGVKVAVKDAPLPPVPELPPPAPPPPVMAMLNVHAKPPPQYEVPLVSKPENPVASATGDPGEGVADGEMHDAASAVEPAGHAAGHPHAMGAAAFAGQ